MPRRPFQFLTLRERMAFGKYIRRERERQDMTLTELARRVDVSIAYLSRILELDPRYVDVVVTRWTRATGDTPEHHRGGNAPD
jgi:predicted transcriptional regulator